MFVGTGHQQCNLYLHVYEFIVIVAIINYLMMIHMIALVIDNVLFSCSVTVCRSSVRWELQSNKQHCTITEAIKE